MEGFKPYRRKGGDIKAQAVDTVLEIPSGGKTIELQPGDYLVLADGQLEGAKKAEFEAAYEPVKKSYNKPKTELTAEQKAQKAATRAANKAAKANQAAQVSSVAI